MILFQVEETQVYLAGSIHHGKPSFYPLPQPVERAFERSKEIWFEAAPVPNHPLFRCPQGTTLRDLVSGGVYVCARLSARWRYGFDSEKVKALKPWVLALQTVEVAYAMEGCKPGCGVEDRLTKFATAAGKRVGYLETAEDQLAVFDSAPAQEQENMLAHCLFKFQAVQKEARDCLTAWLNADLGLSEKLVRNSIELFPSFERLLNGQNCVWAPRLKQIIDLGVPVFVCVGSLHFGGPQSVQCVLEKQYGLRVLQIPTPR